MPTLTKLAFHKITYNYFEDDAGAGVTGTAGATDDGVAGALSIIFESAFPPLKLSDDNKIKTIKTVAKVQVLLSRKSVVF